MKLILNCLVLWFFGLYCISAISQTDIQELGVLPQSIKETSGLLFYNGKLITHNDSGNAAELYELDIETLQITRTIRITNAINIDWEDLAQDDDFIYIADIGNNSGDRLDLGILRISKSDFDMHNEIIAERIDFLYEDQTDFTTTTDSDFDAEALFSLEDDLIVLTKQWQTQGTVAYRIPKLAGSFLAERLDSYQVDGLVTGASFDATTNALYLAGYSQFLTPFFVEILNVDGNAIFGTEQIKGNLSIGQAQVEAITLNDGIFYLTSEEFINPPLLNTAPRLFQLTLDNGEEVPDSGESPEFIDDLLVYKQANSTQLNYQLNTDKPIFGMGIFDASGRKVRYTPLERITDDPIDISTFSQGLYYLAFFYGNSVISSPFFRN